MRCQIIAELATNHGGDLALAEDMIAAAAEAGADIVKTQAYQVAHLRRTDPQYDWFAQCELSDEKHRQLIANAASCGVRYLTTAFCADDLERVARLCGPEHVKIGSGEGSTSIIGLASAHFKTVYASLAWGGPSIVLEDTPNVVWFATVPLYPMPVECYSQITTRPGWSDHAVGIDVAKIAIAQGCQYVEKHFHLPGRGRNQPHNMDPQELRELRRWAEVCEQANTGSKYEGRWTA